MLSRLVFVAYCIVRVLSLFIWILQRYAYSPLVDDVDSDEDDAEATTKSNVAKNVKKRGGDGTQSTAFDPDEKMVSIWIKLDY